MHRVQYLSYAISGEIIVVVVAISAASATSTASATVVTVIVARRVGLDGGRERSDALLGGQAGGKN